VTHNVHRVSFPSIVLAMEKTGTAPTQAVTTQAVGVSTKRRSVAHTSTRVTIPETSETRRNTT
jgi:hypothetical protein